MRTAWKRCKSISSRQSAKIKIVITILTKIYILYIYILDSRHRCPYKQCNHNLYIEIITSLRIDIKQSVIKKCLKKVAHTKMRAPIKLTFHWRWHQSKNIDCRLNSSVGWNRATYNNIKPTRRKQDENDRIPQNIRKTTRKSQIWSQGPPLLTLKAY